eukprot:113647-Rhodomonas_salina.1
MWPCADLDGEDEKLKTFQILARIAARDTTIAVEVRDSDTVDALKRKVEDKEGVPASEQRLVFGGKQLRNARILASYGIGNKTTQAVHVAFRLVGGGAGKSRPVTVAPTIASSGNAAPPPAVSSTPQGSDVDADAMKRAQEQIADLTAQLEAKEK